MIQDIKFLDPTAIKGIFAVGDTWSAPTEWEALLSVCVDKFGIKDADTDAVIALISKALCRGDVNNATALDAEAAQHVAEATEMMESVRKGGVLLLKAQIPIATKLAANPAIENVTVSVMDLDSAPVYEIEITGGGHFERQQFPDIDGIKSIWCSDAWDNGQASWKGTAKAVTEMWNYVNTHMASSLYGMNRIEMLPDESVVTPVPDVAACKGIPTLYSESDCLDECGIGNTATCDCMVRVVLIREGYLQTPIRVYNLNEPATNISELPFLSFARAVGGEGDDMYCRSVVDFRVPIYRDSGIILTTRSKIIHLASYRLKFEPETLH